MKVTVCQINPRPGRLEEYLSNLIDHIAAEDSDFLLLPEMGFSAWLAGSKDVDATKWNASVASHEAHIARLDEMGVDAILGTRPITLANGSRRNEAYIWSAADRRAVGFHQKYYLPDEPDYWEHSWYDRGPKKFDTARALDLRIGVQICTEMWFFEWARHYAAAQADLLCVPRATPHGNTNKWLAGGRAAAVCSGAYCLSSNLWAEAGSGANLGGVGWVIDPDGNILATTDDDTPFVTVDIDPEIARAAKSGYPRYVPE
ncbi:MAG: carbon-nitrogen hydrolase family protein [Pseudomonadota bacterium]